MDIYPKVIGEIESNLLFNSNKEELYCIGTKESNCYLYTKKSDIDIIIEIFSYMDGSLTLKEIENKLKANKKHIQNFMEIYKTIAESGIIEAPLNDKFKRKKSELDIVAIKLKTFNLERFYKLFEIINLKIDIIVIIMLLTDMLGIFLFIKNSFALPWNDLLSDIRTIFYLMPISLICLILHELSHAVVAYRYKLKPKSFIVSIYAYVSFMFYIKIPGMYFLQPKDRIKIWSSGIFMNLFLAGISFIVYNFSSGQIALISSISFIYNIMTITTNLLPFFYSDGYFILATILKIPNLRKESLSRTFSLFKEKVTIKNCVYFLYLVITTISIGYFVFTRGYYIINSILEKILLGYSLNTILMSYINILIISGTAIIGKSISFILKKRKENVQHGNTD